MEFLSHFVRVSVPNYLAGLPIPNDFTGWFKLGGKVNLVFYHLEGLKSYYYYYYVLSVRDWISLVPISVTVAGITYLAYEKLSVSGLNPCNKVQPKGIQEQVQPLYLGRGLN